MFVIYSNNKPLDLGNSQSPNLTKAAARFGSIESREGLYSADFAIPFSVTNFDALGFAIRPGVSGLTPTIGPSPSFAVKIPSRVESDGSIISIGFLQIVKVNYETQEIEIAFFGDNSGWFADLDGLSIRDIDLSEFNHVWNTTNILAGQSTESGYYYPLIDYGSYDNQAASGPLQTHIEDWFPAFYVHTLIRKIFDSIKYKVGGPYINSPRYLREIIAFAEEKLLKSPAQRAAGDANAFIDDFSDTYDAPNTATDTTYLDLTALYPELTYVAPIDIAEINIGFAFTLFTEAIRSNFAAGTISVGLEILKNGTPIITNSAIVSYLGDGTDSGTTTVNQVGSTSVLAGDIITVRLVFTTGGFTVGVSAASLQVDLSNIIWTSETGEELLPGDEIDIAYNLPNITALDLIKDIGIRQGIFFYTDSATKTVNFYTVSEIIGRKWEALDWSEKVDLGKIREWNTSELTENYGRKTWIKYKADGSDPLLADYINRNGQGYGDGYMSINNAWLDASKDLYTSVFAATGMTFVKDGQVYCAQIPHYSDSYASGDSQGSQPRVLLAVPDLNRESFTRSQFIYLEGVDMGDNIGWAYFTKGRWQSGSFAISIDRIADGMAINTPNTVPADNTQSGYEKEYVFIERMINNSIYLSVQMQLYSYEFNQLDFSRPIYISTDGFAGYYLVEEIENYENSQGICTVKLIGI